MSREEPDQVIGYLGRAHVMAARLKTLDEEHKREPGWLSRSSNSEDTQDLGKRPH